jgi:hypothetical protein
MRANLSEKRSNIVESAEHIFSTSKSCPTCATPIYKMDGCNMYRLLTRVEDDKVHLDLLMRFGYCLNYCSLYCSIYCSIYCLICCPFNNILGTSYLYMLWSIYCPIYCHLNSIPDSIECTVYCPAVIGFSEMTV